MRLAQVVDNYSNLFLGETCIQKAFYITYLTSIDKKDANNITEISKNINLRPATAWTFKQKVMALREANKTKKKHKDGWTHLIEYSLPKKLNL